MDQRLLPGTKSVASGPTLYLVSDSDVDRSGGYIGVLFRYMEAETEDGSLHSKPTESHFLMSPNEARGLRDMLNHALAATSAIIHH